MSRSPLFLLVAVAVVTQAAASDLARERRIRALIEGDVRTGEVVTLQTGELQFLAIRTPAQSAQSHGAVVLLHGLEATPDAIELIRPLRTHLPAHGWETLSLQMPVAAGDAPPKDYLTLIPESVPRIAFAVESIKARQIRNIVLVGHGLGARMALEWMAQDPPEEVRSLVIIGLEAEPRRPSDPALAALKRIKRPMLDIFGSRDLDSVRGSAEARASAARAAGNTDYRQVVIEGADHWFTGLGDSLVARVRAWLAKNAPGMELTPEEPIKDPRP